MITKYQIFEGLLDKMTPKSEKEINGILEKILTGDNLLIIRNYYNFIYGENNYYFSLQDIYTKFAQLLSFDYVYKTTIDLIPELEDEYSNTKDIIDSIWSYFYNNIKFIKFLEYLIESYDTNKFKKIIIKELNKKYNINL